MEFVPISWVFPRMSFPQTNARIFKICSFVTITLVGFFSKIVVCYLNRTKTYNLQILENAVESRNPGQPLLTISNHTSCCDDPGIWGLLKFKNACSSYKMRWSMAAHDICFSHKLHSMFFMHGKCIPVVRGEGVYQPAVDLCVEKLKLGDWVHIFPEGKVNMDHSFIRFKWGVGRIIYEYMKALEQNTLPPIIIPIWHEGMEQLLPNYPPYYFRLGKKLTFNIGKPIDLSELVKRLIDSNSDDVDARKQITDEIQKELMILKTETRKLHYDSSEKS